MAILMNGGFYLGVDLYQEGSAPAACAAGLLPHMTTTTLGKPRLGMNNPSFEITSLFMLAIPRCQDPQLSHCCYFFTTLMMFQVLLYYKSSYCIIGRAVHQSLSFDLNRCLAPIAFDRDFISISDTPEGRWWFLRY